MELSEAMRILKKLTKYADEMFYIVEADEMHFLLKKTEKEAIDTVLQVVDQNKGYYNLNNYISKDKIKEKIKELELQRSGKWCWEQQEEIKQIEILQELLKGE